MRFAAIDIGSNAIRMLISDIRNYRDGSPDVTKLTLVRIPVRLGFDVFEHGEIGKEKEKRIISAIKAYQHLLLAFEVNNFKAVATSAMRDAKNGKKIIKTIAKKTGFHINIISGPEEAQLLYQSQWVDKLNPKKVHCYIDVGGGSTEISFFTQNEILEQASFNIGTIRLLKNKFEKQEWEAMKYFIKKTSNKFAGVMAVGSGGNINKIFSLSKTKPGTPLSYLLLKSYYDDLKKLTVEDRIHRYYLREDRADVIVPALKIYLSILKWGKFKNIYVPQVGLVDGIIHELYNQALEENNKS